MMIYDAIVVGKGLIGAAVARHLSMAVKNMAVIGPDEPADYHKATVFSSHYDSGRVQRLIGQTDALTRLNAASVASYPLIEKRSGISFHVGCGCLYVNPAGTDKYMQEVSERSRKFNIPAAVFHSGSDLNKAFPEFSFPESSVGMFEKTPSGYISPPQLIQAQLRIFEQQGGSIFRETVSGISFRNDRAEISTTNGNAYTAKKVIVAAGAFSNFCNLLPRRISLVLKSETVLLARLGMSEVKRLAALPSLLYEIDTPEVEGIYLTQPIRYPDGNYYLKMGCNLFQDIFFGTDLSEIQEWFRNGNSAANTELMKSALLHIMPGLRIESCITKRCILPRTQQHKNPYIGMMHEHLFVTAGNGWSAMCADGIGYVMAHLVLHGAFPDGFAEEDYEVIYESQ